MPGLILGPSPARLASIAPEDTTAPSISASDIVDGAELTVSWSTNEGNGTAYWLISTVAFVTAAQVIAGGGLGSGSVAVTEAGAQPDIVIDTGLPGNDTRRRHLVHVDGAGNASAVASAPFTTDPFITLEGSASSGFAPGAGVGTLNFPTLQTDDFVLVALASDGEINPGAGGVVGQGYTTLESTTSGSPGRQLAYKVMGVTPDTGVNITRDPSLRTAAVAMFFRGVDTVTPLDGSLLSTALASGMPNPPALTTTVANAMRVIVGMIDDDVFSDTGVTAPFGDLVFQNADTTAEISAQVMMAVWADPIARSWNPDFTGSGSDINWAAHLALRPDGA